MSHQRELSEEIVDEAWSRGKTLLIDDLVDLVARHDDDGENGVRVDRLVAYAERLDEEGHPVDPERIRPAIDERLVDDAEFVGEDALYRIGVDEGDRGEFGSTDAGATDGGRGDDAGGRSEDDEPEAEADDRSERTNGEGGDDVDSQPADGDGTDTDDAASQPPDDATENGADAEAAEEREADVDDDAETADEHPRERLGVDVEDDDRVSLYPQSWYDGLAGERDVTRYVEFVAARRTFDESKTDHGGAGDATADDGVPLEVLLEVASVVGGLDRDHVRGEVERLRDEGVLVEDADQHPNANVRLADGTS